MTMTALAHYPLADLKVVYTALHAALVQAPLLMDNALLEDLQAYLIKQARHAGIDVADHGAWSAWLSEIDT